MTKENFIHWLEGYVEGRLVLEPKFTYTREILTTIEERLNEIQDQEKVLLLDSSNTNSTLS